jgi:DNA replicative helicase MCM subunit Mcm2 (Cdc46/Mcm family)
MKRSTGDLHNWAGFAERLLEHMLRIAGTLAAFERKNQVDEVDVAAAMDLMDYFVEQRLNLELGITSRNQSQVMAVNRLGAWIQEKKFTGTSKNLKDRVRWFKNISPTEQDQILEDLVRSEQAFIRTTVSKNHKTTITYSYQDEDCADK